MNRPIRFMVAANSWVVAGLAFWFLFGPVLMLWADLRDPGLRDGQVPRRAFRWQRDLAGPYERWARRRVASGRAAALKVGDVSGTEWPMFGSVFFLWATEALQDAWEADPGLAAQAPAVASRGAIEAAADLIADPGHAGWVKTHWGDEYLSRENLFYRMLLIAGLTSRERLLGWGPHHDLLVEQVESLALEIDRSPFGLLDDYPGECYPIDVLPAVAVIRRADAVLGTDHSAFVARALRAFEGGRLDRSTGLPAYEVEARSGVAIGPSRGVGVAYMLIWAPELWPETARAWYALFAGRYWRTDPLLSGFREYARGSGRPEWGFEVDAGPVIAGFGTAASAFGVGASRVNGRFDHAYPLAVEALAASWPLPDGTRLVPRFLSNAVDAPYLGEAALLFCLTRTPAQGVTLIPGRGGMPGLVYLTAAFWIVGGSVTLTATFQAWRRWRRGGESWIVPLGRFQFAAWSALMIAALATLATSRPGVALLFALAGQLLPRGARWTAPPGPSSPDGS
ncbi:MAG: hypothetical protein AB7I30_23500 [Isosphaeraceae bacterium]